ncbi:MAG: nicotinamide-nucleotide amidase [Dehalococcoidia bacterium]
MDVWEHDELAASIGEVLAGHGWRLALAESTAGGLISARLLSVAGASRWFDRGIVAYSAAAKRQALDLDADVLLTHGAVSVETVSLTAEGLRRSAGVDFAVAESGIAGPQGSRRSPKPVGTVVIGVAGPERTRCEERHFEGSRVQIMGQIAEAALQMLADEVAHAARSAPAPAE